MTALLPSSCETALDTLYDPVDVGGTGTLTAEEGVYLVTFIPNTGEATRAIFTFLQTIGMASPLPEMSFQKHSFFDVTSSIEYAVVQMERTLENLAVPARPSSPSLSSHPAFARSSTLTPPPRHNASEGQIHASVFSLARSLTHKKPSPQPSLRHETSALSPFSSLSTVSTSSKHKEGALLKVLRDKEEGGEKHQQQHSEQHPEKKRVKKVAGVAEKRASTPTAPAAEGVQKALQGMDNIFIRFMALMARILGQAEAEAQQLYTRIKHRTDGIDVLTLFISKINTHKGAIDWTKNEEMKQLLEKVRALGVEIPPDKLKWTEDEKKALKENVQLRKESMERVTQLERTDMQRFLQEVSQAHQARSHFLKALKEVLDTLIHNLRPN